MIDFGGKKYVLELTNLEKTLKIGYNKNESIKEVFDETRVLKNTEKLSVNDNSNANMVMYDIIFKLIDIITNTNGEEISEDMGADFGLSKSSFEFKLAYNTLIKYKILVEIE